MKFILILFSLYSINFFSQNCSTVFVSDFSNSTQWSSQGSGDVYVSGGKCIFNNAYCGDYNRVYTNIGLTLSNNYWKATCDFSIVNSNPSGYGTGAVVMALTAGTLDFLTFNSSLSYAETNQDGIGVLLASTDPYNNDINNWQLFIVNKKGSTRLISSSFISLSSSVSNYYIMLERTATNTAKLSIFSDASFTTHLAGSPFTFSIDPTITGLNTIQHGVSTPGYYYRLLNATIDNDNICQIDAIGIHEFSNNEINTSFYPNPVISEGNIHIPSSYNNISIKLFNIIGKEVNVELSQHDEIYSFKKNDLSSGVYSYQIFSGSKKISTGKVMIK